MPTGGGPCSISTPTLVGGQCTGVQITKLQGGQIRLLTLGGVNFGIRLLGADLMGGDLVQQTEKQKTSNILY